MLFPSDRPTRCKAKCARPPATTKQDISRRRCPAPSLTGYVSARPAPGAGRGARLLSRCEQQRDREGNASDDLYVEGQLEFNIGERVEGWIRYGHAEWNQARRSTIATTPYDIAPTYFGGLFPNSTFNGTPTQPVSVPLHGDQSQTTPIIGCITTTRHSEPIWMVTTPLSWS